MAKSNVSSAAIEPEAFHSTGRRIDEVLPLDRPGENRFQRIQLAIDCPRFDGLGGPFLRESPPRSVEAIALELFDPVLRDFVEDHRAEKAVQRLQNFAIAFGAAFVEIRVIAQIDVCELFERDIGLAADAVTTIKDP